MQAPTRTATAAPVELDLDARLALVGALMDQRLALANVTFEVDTAHLPASDPIPAVVAPPVIQPAAAPGPYATRAAGTLHRARVRLEASGWCTGQLRDEQGARCLIGAIRAEAPSRGTADDACTVLLEAIRRDFSDVETVASWNDRQASLRPALLYLDRAAVLADSRGL